jgi:hypothetical protein
VVQPERSFAFAIVLLHSPTQPGQTDQLHQRVVWGRLDSQYLVGWGLPTGHWTSSQHTGSTPPAARAGRPGVTPAGPTPSARKRPRCRPLLPRRQLSSTQAG